MNGKALGPYHLASHFNTQTLKCTFISGNGIIISNENSSYMA